MTAAITQHQAGSLAGLDDATMQKLVAGGDCSSLSPVQKVAYYQARCEAAGLDPRAQPFAFMRLNGKEVLYAQKAASDQLAAKNGVRLTIVSQVTEDGIRMVTVRAEAKDGRVTEDIGSLPVKGLVGEALSNALMKCVTKAKRRAVLSLCGLGMLDETEVDSIPAARPAVLLAPASAQDTPTKAYVDATATPPPPEPESAPAAAVAQADAVDALASASDPMDELVSQGEIDDAWRRAVERYGNQSEAAYAWKEAATLVFGKRVPDPKKWQRWQMRDVLTRLFPDDGGPIPF